MKGAPRLSSLAWVVGKEAEVPWQPLKISDGARLPQHQEEHQVLLKGEL